MGFRLRQVPVVSEDCLRSVEPATTDKLLRHDRGLSWSRRRDGKMMSTLKSDDEIVEPEWNDYGDCPAVLQVFDRIREMDRDDRLRLRKGTDAPLRCPADDRGPVVQEVHHHSLHRFYLSAASCGTHRTAPAFLQVTGAVGTQVASNSLVVARGGVGMYPRSLGAREKIGT